MMEKLGSKLQGNVKRQKKAAGTSGTRQTRHILLLVAASCVKAITFIAVIAGQAFLCFQWSYCVHLAEQVDDAFAPYYGHLMPLLKQATKNLLQTRMPDKILLPCAQGVVGVVLPKEQKHVSVYVWCARCCESLAATWRFGRSSRTLCTRQRRASAVRLSPVSLGPRF